MSLNSTSSSNTNDSLLQPHVPLSVLQEVMYCYITAPSSFIFISYNIANILLLLPLCTFILYHGLQTCWLRRSTSCTLTVTHSECFLYHMVMVELIRVFASLLLLCAVFRKDSGLPLLVGTILLYLTWYAETFFHVLTCVERYLAVVHPITYLSLRKERGVRMRNISIGCTWLLSFVGSGLTKINDFVVIMNFLLLVFSFIVVSFFSPAVLCVLIRPGPGEQGRNRERVDQSKQRAVYTIVAILAVLVVRFAASLVWTILSVVGSGEDCMTLMFGLLFVLPGSLVLPLLFVYREGKLTCCKKNVQRG